MLLEFSCSNHKSIRNKVLFSALAGSDNTNEDMLADINGIRVLKSAVIYGANGSGKSNFVDAIAFVKNLVMNSINHQPGEGIRQIPHKLESVSTDSCYAMQFIANGVRFAFGFTLNNLLVKEEYLYYFPNGRQTKIFERENENFTAGNKFRNKFNSCKDVMKSNRLLLSCAANFSMVQEVQDVFAFFRDELVIYNPNNGVDESWMNYSLHQMNTNPEMKQAVLKLMRGLDMGVQDIKVKIEQADVDATALPDFLSDDFKSNLLREKINVVSARVVYDTFETDLFTEESNGVKKLFAFLSPFMDIMMNGKILICDELETSLHESLVHGLVRLFMQQKYESQAQLFFTTHDTSLLDTDIFRRDQIWFTELDQKDRSTELYSLIEVKNIRKDEKFGKGYISGRYGAIPMLNVNFADIVRKAERG